MRAIIFFALMFSQMSFAKMAAPTDPANPGSPVYAMSFKKLDVRCAGRTVNVFKPDPMPATPTALIVFGHGQALNVSHYQATLEHLAKKGFVAIHPSFDTGFFDQNWTRMANDYIAQTECVLAQFPGQIDPKAIIFSGHSKGAYVASIASGNAFNRVNGIRPAAAVIFANAGTDRVATARIAKEVELTLVYSDADTIVPISHSQAAFDSARSERKQLISLKSYPAPNALKADHMFPVSKSTAFGGGPVGPFHYYGTWKWLTAAAEDALQGGQGLHPYLYGNEALDKGSPSVRDEALRNY